MPKSKVLLLLHELSWTGAPRLALQTFSWLTEHLDIRILAFESGPREAEAREIGDLQILLKPFPLGALNGAVKLAPRGAGLRLGGQALNLSGSMNRWKPDLIYANTVVSMNAFRYLRLPQAPVLLHVHELGSALDSVGSRFPHLLCEKPNAYLADSEAVRLALAERYAVNKEKVEVVYPFINPQDFGGLEVTDPAMPTPQRPLIVGGAGRVTWCKGTELWLQMAAELRQMLGEDCVRFKWLGQGDPENVLHFHETIRLLNLQKCVEHIVSVPNPYPLFASFDVFALSSWEDACPLVTLENMMLSHLVVCFRDGGGAVEEIGNTGIAVPHFSPSEMARAIADLAHQPETRKRMGQEAKQRVIENFTIEAQAPKIHKCILSVIEESSRL